MLKKVTETPQEGVVDMCGGMVFLLDNFFSTPTLNIQFFSDLIKSKHFFSQRWNTKQVFNHLFHLILGTPFYVLEVSPHLRGISPTIFDKERYCVEYIQQNC